MKDTKTSNGQASDSKTSGKLKRGKGKRKKPVFPMRECALKSCKIAFYPTRPWHKFHSPACSNLDRQQRMQARYRDLAERYSGDLVRTKGMRKVVGPKKSEKGIDGPPRNRSPEPDMDIPARVPVTATVADPTSDPVMVSHRLRRIRHVHPRSLQRIAD